MLVCGHLPFRLPAFCDSPPARWELVSAVCMLALALRLCIYFELRSTWTIPANMATSIATWMMILLSKKFTTHNGVENEKRS